MLTVAQHCSVFLLFLHFFDLIKIILKLEMQEAGTGNKSNFTGHEIASNKNKQQKNRLNSIKNLLLQEQKQFCAFAS